MRQCWEFTDPLQEKLYSWVFPTFSISLMAEDISEECSAQTAFLSISLFKYFEDGRWKKKKAL